MLQRVVANPPGLPEIGSPFAIREIVHPRKGESGHMRLDAEALACEDGGLDLVGLGGGE
jgi:hypothetical protein